jgi:hypothetical protein
VCYGNGLVLKSVITLAIYILAVGTTWQSVLSFFFIRAEWSSEVYLKAHTNMEILCEVYWDKENPSYKLMTILQQIRFELPFHVQSLLKTGFY